MYLKLTEHYRLDVVSKLEKYRDGELDTPPKIPRRLAKLPHVFKVLVDRDFDGDNLSYPFFNIVVTPEFLVHEKKQFTLPQVERDPKICQLRDTCEMVFSRVTTY